MPARRIPFPWLVWPGLWLAGLLAGVGLHARAIPFGFRSTTTDFLIAHAYPVAFVREMLHQGYGLPLWYPGQLGGYPLYADPLTAQAYPPGWLAYAFPVPAGLLLAVALHLFLGTLGTMVALRDTVRNPWLAGAWATVWILLPKTAATVAAGHVTLLYSLAWLPWTLAAHRACRGGLMALTLGLATLADPRGGLLTAMALVVVTLVRRKGKRDLVLALVLAGGVAAALLVPLARFALMTPREHNRSLDYVWNPPTALGFLLPGFLSPDPEATVYLPWAVALPALAVLLPRRNPENAALAATGVVLSLVQPVLVRVVPGLAQFRVPLRWLWLLYVAALFAAAQARQEDFRTPAMRRLLAVALGLSMAQVVGLGVLHAARPAWAWTLIGLDAAALLVALLAAHTRARVPMGLWPGLALAAGMVFWSGFVTFRPAETAEPEGQALIRAARTLLAEAATDWTGPRVLDPTFRLLPWRAAQAYLPLAHGVHPLYFATYDNAVHQALGWRRPAYTPSVPYYAETGFMPLHPDAELLALLRIGVLVAPRPLSLPWSPAARVGDVVLYRIPQPCPYAWLEPPEALGQGCRKANALAVQWTPNEVVLTVKGPGRVVLTENAFPEWQAEVDGQPQPTVRAYRVWRAVDVPPGRHTVRWRLVPRSLYLGGAITLVSLVLALLWEERFLVEALCEQKNPSAPSFTP